ncbi:Hypothetical predicted protein [Mytilus galloprovincialis]|uniref:Endonuclease/exonuclease/phosphatase domain-containing protein n=1 Tax=Mytilus galloprovincialis TaxID=29158 RepID=A0A8B6D1X8_MYTGA|nr:Hypothetical predicted protein [Mytilus galloprovincialis]
MYSTFSKVDERAAGGSSIFVKDNVIHSTVQLTTDLQAVAIRLSLDKTITLCSIYIPPNSIIDKAKLKNLTDQLPSPFILMGDFNAHNPLRGSKTHNAKGKIIEDFVSQEGLCIFNDGSNTYLHPGNGSYSSIDITICDPSLLLDYSWRVHDDLCGSDHFPIVLEHLFTSAQQRSLSDLAVFVSGNWPRLSVENNQSKISWVNQKLAIMRRRAPAVKLTDEEFGHNYLN